MSKLKRPRNFWLEARWDGRQSPLRGGPAARGDVMEVDIRVRDGGESVIAYSILCAEKEDGRLEVKVLDGETGELVDMIRVQR